MKILIDTNVILDVLCNRNEFIAASSKVIKLCEVNKFEGYISALSIPNIVYIMRKELTPQKTAQLIQSLFTIFQIIDLKTNDIKNAAQFYSNDFEDAIQFCQAKRINADYIVTRNIRDFLNSKVPALQPSELLDRYM